MIKQLRHRFIKITSLALFGIIILITIAINLVNLSIHNAEFNSTLDLIAEHNGQLPILKKNETVNKNTDQHFISKKDSTLQSQFRTQFNKERFYTTRYCSITLSPDDEILSLNTDRISALSEDEIRSYTQAILKKGASSGWKGVYRYRLVLQNETNLLILLDASTALEDMLSILLISVLVACTTYLLLFVIIVFSAKYAIRPIANAYEKQKQFITDAGHELKTPLTIISANTELLEMTYGEDDWILGIKKQTESMKYLISNLIQLARMDEEDHSIGMDPFLLSDALLDTIQVFELMSSARGLTLTYDIQPEIMISGNEALLRQLFSILMDNAIKYCDSDGSIEVELKQEHHPVLRVKNSFQNCPQVDLDQLFDRFYRSDKSRTTKGSYGLGLSIARSIAQCHHGKLKAYWNHEAQIVFELQLPSH